MENYEKCGPHRRMYMGEENFFFHKPTASGKPEAKIMQKRGASSQRTHADHSRRETQQVDLSWTSDTVNMRVDVQCKKTGK